jgi:hypothetical protein
MGKHSRKKNKSANHRKDGFSHRQSVSLPGMPMANQQAVVHCRSMIPVSGSGDTNITLARLAEGGTVSSTFGYDGTPYY